MIAEPTLQQAIDAYLTGRNADGSALRAALEQAQEASRRQQSVRGVQTSLLFTDIVDSSRAFVRYGDRYGRQIVAIHDDIVGAQVEHLGGDRVKHTGDGMLASFSACAAAVESAVQIQSRVAAHNRDYPLLPLRLRIGINVGEVIAEEHDIFGFSVALASRICDAAGPECIFTTGIVEARLREGRAAFRFADQGRLRVKGFDQPVPVFEVRWRA